MSKGGGVKYKLNYKVLTVFVKFVMLLFNDSVIKHNTLCTFLFYIIDFFTVFEKLQFKTNMSIELKTKIQSLMNNLYKYIHGKLGLNIGY